MQTALQEDRNRDFFLRPAALLAISIVVVCAVSIAYVGGVMSGRKSAEKECEIRLEQLPKAPIAAPPIAPTSTDILAPEELEFVRVLRNDQRLFDRTPIQVKPRAVAAAKIEPSAPQTPPPLEPAKPVFIKGYNDYVYQVAAIKGEDNADALRQRLEGRGLRTYLKRAGNLLLIQVRMRGDAARCNELIHMLESMHLGRPILISQSPVRE